MPPRNSQPAPQPKGNTDNALVAINREIDNRMAIIAASSAAGVDPERFKYVALTVLTRTPALMRCTPISIARAIVEASQLGLEIGSGALPGAYLVPYRNRETGLEEVQLIPSYKGLIDLARRSGQIAKVEARAVREGDRFEYWYGLRPDLIHVPATAAERGGVEYVYAIAFFKDGLPQFDVMSRAEVEVIHRRSKAADSGPWVSDYEAMALKTVLRRLCKLLPLTKDAQDVLDREDAAEATALPPEPQAPTKATELRAQLRAQLLGDGTADEPVNVTPVEEPAPAPAPLPPAAPVAPQPAPAAAYAGGHACGAVAPDGSATCGLAAGHNGPHGDLPEEPDQIWPAQ